MYVFRVFHDKDVKALDCGDQVANWFKEFLNEEDLRLYYHHVPHTQRTFEPYMYDCPQYLPTDMVRQTKISQLVKGPATGTLQYFFLTGETGSFSK